MNKNKNQKRKVALSQKKALTTLQFQAEWGLKQLNGRESILQQQLSNELTLIEQLDFTQDLLAIQKFTIHVQRKYSKKCTFYTLRFGCSFAAVNTIKPQLL